LQESSGLQQIPESGLDYFKVLKCINSLRNTRFLLHLFSIRVVILAPTHRFMGRVISPTYQSHPAASTRSGTTFVRGYSAGLPQYSSIADEVSSTRPGKREVGTAITAVGRQSELKGHAARRSVCDKNRIPLASGSNSMISRGKHVSPVVRRPPHKIPIYQPGGPLLLRMPASH